MLIKRRKKSVRFKKLLIENFPQPLKIYFRIHVLTKCLRKKCVLEKSTCTEFASSLFQELTTKFIYKCFIIAINLVVGQQELCTL